ncbi:hypothetical protein [Marinibacterium profundimaris]|uniref:Transmembrane protein n=1 Tax=Marinibacterium profundimaris TaxID=1679460 RepID=A0A225NAI6_9RHOB|nr:hypothetical protein [Marinibacterium profundimaris]OWU66987.1 hypothetical protein ATO3_26860 [Marinibacterium profundimaris]
MTEDHAPRPCEDAAEFAEEQSRLWTITLGPLAWALHFVVCYGLVAVTCAKGWDYTAVRSGLLIFSAGALLGVAWIGWRAWHQWNPRKTGDAIDRHGRAEDRHHFLGHAAFLLAIIAFLGVVFVSLPLVMIGGCR